MLEVEVPANRITRYEGIEEGKPYREFLVPADVLNTIATVSQVPEQDEDEWPAPPEG